jgi:hypothetical protein
MATLTAGTPLDEVAQILHAAAVLDPGAWNGQHFPEAQLSSNIEGGLRDDLLDLFGRLHSRGIAYLLVGGVAMLTYVDGRNTRDVDLVLSLASLERLSEITISQRNGDFARGHFRTLQVDVLLTTNPVFELVQQTYAQVHRFLEIDVRCATIQGLLLLKFYALPDLYRRGEGQRIGLCENDIFMLCERYRPNLEPLFTTLQPHLEGGQLRELRTIADDIYKRIERVDRGKDAASGKP